MAQTAITTKHTLTVLTGTAGVDFTPAGRDSSQVLRWRQIIDPTVPLADGQFSLSSQAKYAEGGLAGWKSKQTYSVPVMSTLATGSTSSGYVATPSIAGKLNFTLNVDRTGLMSQTAALQAYDQWLYAQLTDAKLRAGVLGFNQADL